MPSRRRSRRWLRRSACATRRTSVERTRDPRRRSPSNTTPRPRCSRRSTICPAGASSAGETLKIPVGQRTAAGQGAARRGARRRPETDTGGRRQRQIVYRVRAGETLNSIARRHGMPVSTLARLNNLGAGDTADQGPAAGHQGERAALSRRGHQERPAHAVHGAPRRHRVQHLAGSSRSRSRS